MSENDKEAEGINASEEKQSSWRSRLERLKSATILAKQRPQNYIPENVLQFFRSMADPSEDDPELQKIQSPYRYAKERLNKIWAGRESYDNEDQSPVAKLTTMRGAVTHYFTSENWKRGAMQVGAIAGLATLTAANTVWVAESVASVFSIASEKLSTNNDVDPSALSWALLKLGAFGGLQTLSAWSMVKVGGGLAKDISLSIKRQFGLAAFEEPDMLYRISHNTKDEDAPDFMPDNPHQRINDAADGFANGLVRIGTDSYLAAVTTAFVGMALYNNSVPIEALNGLGEQLNTMFPNAEVDFKEKGTFVAAVGVISAYLGITIPKGILISEQIKETYKTYQNKSANITQKLMKAFDNSEAIAASKSHQSTHEDLEAAIKELDKAWRDENDNFARYIMFMQGQSFVGHNIVAFLPSYFSTFGDEGILTSENPFQTFVKTQALVSSMLASMSQVVYLLPEYARMKGQLERMNEMAKMFELARDKETFFRLSGIHEFENKTLDEASKDIALRVTDFELMHRGETENFVKAPSLEIQKGDWVHIQAPSGAGKSCLLRGLAGYWGYGRGTVERQDGAAVFYAHQSPDLSGSETLMDHLIYGMPGAVSHEITDLDKEKMKQALNEAGLGQFVSELESADVGGKSWEDILSGGQKQRIVLARILYQEPDLIMLDEATSALDPQAKREFFEKLDMYCGDATLMAITHDENRPMDDHGAEYFNRRLTIQDGIVSLHDIEEYYAYREDLDVEIRAE